MADAQYRCETPGGILGAEGIWPYGEWRIIDDSEPWVARWEAAAMIRRGDTPRAPSPKKPKPASGADES